MKLTNNQFEAVAYIFEKANGNVMSEYEEEIISESGLSQLEPVTLEKIIVDGLNNGIYTEKADRISGYWVLGKRFNIDLIPFFRKWLKSELDLNESHTVYQLLISLGNMEEQVFSPDRKGSSSFNETELNLKYAKDYLQNLR
tara:strand:- start:1226 stop:1651 length:426 start_codon:yes stop_codon:yes gene_type:complete